MNPGSGMCMSEKQVKWPPCQARLLGQPGQPLPATSWSQAPADAVKDGEAGQDRQICSPRSRREGPPSKVQAQAHHGVT